MVLYKPASAKLQMLPIRDCWISVYTLRSRSKVEILSSSQIVECNLTPSAAAGHDVSLEAD